MLATWILCTALGTAFVGVPFLTMIDRARGR